MPAVSVARAACVLVAVALAPAWSESSVWPQEIGTGRTQSCALLGDGGLVCWQVILLDPASGFGPVGFGTEPRSIEGLPRLATYDGGYQFDCGLTQEGAPVCWVPAFEDAGDHYRVLEVLPASESPPLVSLSVGFEHLCGLDAAGAVWCLGSNVLGERGTGAALEPAVANRVEGLDRAVSVSAGVNNSCAVTTAGLAYCWGSDNNQFPDRPFVFGSPNPTQIEGVRDLWSVKNGRNFACALGGGQRLVCWGSNIMGQLAASESEVAGAGVVTRTFTVAIRHLDVGFFSACAVLESGNVWCWGNWYDEIWGELRRIEGLPPARAVTVGSDAGCILSEAGEVWCWGQTLSGRLDAPTINTTPPRRVLGSLPG